METIRSRAPTFRTEPIDPQTIGQHLCRVSKEAQTLKETSPAEFAEILAAADGSIGMALTLLDPKLRRPIINRRQNAREFIGLCANRKNSAAALKFLNSLSQKRDELSLQLGVFLLALRDLLLCKQTENAPLCFFGDREEAASLAYRFTTPRLLALCTALQETDTRLQANANVRLTITDFLIRTTRQYCE